ncbi:hypothetical protein BpHYR1_052900 [Brachionus plicatilis]|uniref:Uncharacterized protein n=1 Tax=Brachionus plicatilis TaxID=10195 RepID=A0A3M7RSA7_BRAPC|nr:hypothetical protein BpHYR1_052900 [Brachionus plicatilis]
MDAVNENQKRACSNLEEKGSKTPRLDNSINDQDKYAMIEKFFSVEKAVVEFAQWYKEYPQIIQNYRKHYQNLEKLNQIQYNQVEKELPCVIYHIQESSDHPVLHYLKHIKKAAQQLNDYLNVN